MLARIGNALVDSDSVLYAICLDNEMEVEVVFKDKRKVRVECESPTADLNDYYLQVLNGKPVMKAA